MLPPAVLILIGGDGREEVARIREAVGADRAALRQGKRAAVILTEVAAGRPVSELDADLHAARDDRDLAWLDVDDAELGRKPQLALLRHEEHLAVGIVEILVRHRAGDEIDMRSHAGLRAGVPGRRDRAHAFEKGEFLVWNGDRIPAHRRERHIDFGAGAVRHRPTSAFSNCPQCATVGRMR